MTMPEQSRNFRWLWFPVGVALAHEQCGAKPTQPRAWRGFRRLASYRYPVTGWK